MPTYEYACESCNKRYEKREGFDAPARQKCQHCGKQARRVLHAPPVVFKGSGFYKTDNRGGGGASADSSAKVSAGANGHSHAHGSDGSHVDAGSSGGDSASTDSSTATEPAAAS
ncbi:MAG: FmdB family transcriptional regulator [Chloroflexi bacterium]|nr:FmdB family transcriptional regulator [Chloroflexota bacterium]